MASKQQPARDFEEVSSGPNPSTRKALPTIQVLPGQIGRAVDELAAALVQAEQPVLVRAATLVQPIWTEMPTSHGRKTKVTVLRALTPNNVAYMASKHACLFVRFDARTQTLAPINPPERILRALLELGHWPFPRVAGVLNAPTLRPDGSVLAEPGYDASTQLWLWPDQNVALPPLKTSKTAAQSALRILKEELLGGFPFVSPLDRSVALAAIITVLARGAFTVAPMFLFLAHMPGTGKSYLVNLISHIATGRPCPVITASNSAEEMEKRLGALLLEAPLMISLDNCSHDLGGDLLCQITEQPSVRVRILGKSETPECEWRGSFFATGNNIRLAGDMTRRGLPCKLDAQEERPEVRSFAFDPIRRVLEDRGRYIAAALTIASAYHASGEAVLCAPLGSYEGWSHFVREPLVWLGEPDPVDAMKEAQADDPERDAARELVRHWLEHLGTDRAYRVREIIDKASETTQVDVSDWVQVRPAFHELLVTQAGARGGTVDGVRLGKWLGRIRGQVHDGHRIELEDKSEGHGNRWKLVQVRAQ